MYIDKAIGIDLGTTNSCVGIMNDTDSEVILFKDKFGVSTTPSCIWYNAKLNKIILTGYQDNMNFILIRHLERRLQGVERNLNIP